MQAYFDEMPESERCRQIAEARRLAKLETSGSKSGERLLQRGREQGKQRLKGHSAFLDALKANKAECTFAFSNGSTLIGIIEHHDDSTISVKPKEKSEPVRVIIKSSLDYFSPVEVKA